ncbi:MAG: dGTP triphosphohydrolase [Opitutales bacterium]
MAQAPFYTSQDLDRWPPEGQIKTSDAETRSLFQIERDRIIFSYAFRRLQSKTQVFQSGDYDFYRTRLTHSIEVAKIGRSIVDRVNLLLQERSPEPVTVDADLVEAACLAHDLGHPPFGHIGERTLNDCMLQQGGFEGNAQTLRILTELIFDRPEGSQGMNPTRALLDSVLKYKQTFSERTQVDDQGAPKYPKNHFVYDEQAEIINWVHLDGALPKRKSLECQIMDWSDDTAYSLNDLSDGIQAGYISVQKLQDWADSQADLQAEDHHHIKRLCDAIRSQSYERRHAAKIGTFIRSVEIIRSEDSSTSGRYAWTLQIDPAVERECSIYKRIAFDLIFKSPQVQQSEFRGRYLVQNLFEALEDTYIGSSSASLRILPDAWDRRIRDADSTIHRYRILCDALSSFTDGEAIRLYMRLFRADYGSLSDIL